MPRNITVLGIHDGHSSGAALIRDGQVLAAIDEERLNNIKNYGGAPLGSIKTVFTIAKIGPSEVDVIALASLLRLHPPLSEKPFYVKIFQRLSPYLHSHAFASIIFMAIPLLELQKSLLQP
jgi:carbamoyltransferase